MALSEGKAGYFLSSWKCVVTNCLWTDQRPYVFFLISIISKVISWLMTHSSRKWTVNTTVLDTGEYQTRISILYPTKYVKFSCHTTDNNAIEESWSLPAGLGVELYTWHCHFNLRWGVEATAFQPVLVLFHLAGEEQDVSRLEVAFLQTEHSLQDETKGLT